MRQPHRQILRGPSLQVNAVGAKGILGADGVPRRAYPEGGSDAHSGFGDFDDRDGFDGDGGSGPDVRSGLSGLPACVWPGGQLLRMPLHVAASVQRVGIRPRRPVRHQSIFCERASARSAASPRLLKLSSEQDLWVNEVVCPENRYPLFRTSSMKFDSSNRDHDLTI